MNLKEKTNFKDVDETDYLQVYSAAFSHFFTFYTCIIYMSVKWKKISKFFMMY